MNRMATFMPATIRKRGRKQEAGSGQGEENEAVLIPAGRFLLPTPVFNSSSLLLASSCDIYFPDPARYDPGNLF